MKFLSKVATIADTQHKLTAEMKLKSGETFPVGASFTLKFIEDKPTLVELHGLRETPVTVRITSLHKYTTGFKVPSMATMEKWMYDAVAKSVTGKRCEPDGHGDDGSPSWLLAVGLI